MNVDLSFMADNDELPTGKLNHEMLKVVESDQNMSASKKSSFSFKSNGDNMRGEITLARRTLSWNASEMPWKGMMYRMHSS